MCVFIFILQFQSCRASRIATLSTESSEHPKCLERVKESEGGNATVKNHTGKGCSGTYF